MPRTISDHEMERRKAVARAQSDMTSTMSGHELTALEWIMVFHEALGRMLARGLREEWKEGKRDG